MAESSSSDAALGGTDTADEGVSAEGQALEEWRKAHVVGKFIVPVEELKAPDHRVAARGVSDEHVQTLMKNFQKSGTVTSTVKVCILDGAFYTNFSEARARQSSSSDYPIRIDTAVHDFSDLTDLWAEHCGDSDKSMYLGTVCGYHSTLACKKLHADYPCQDLYKKIEVEVWACAETDGAFRNLQNLGALDNMKEHLKSDFATLVRTCHGRIEDRRTQNLEITDEWANQKKADMSFTNNLQKGNMGHIWQLAMKSGKVWDVLEDILLGKFKVVSKDQKLKNKKPNSVSHFTNMGGVSDKEIVKVLTKVLKNEMSWTDAKVRFATYKVMKRLQALAGFIMDQFHFCKFDKRAKETLTGKGSKSLPQTVKNKIYVEHFTSKCMKAFPCFSKSWLKNWASAYAALPASQEIPPGFQEQVRELAQNEVQTRNQKEKVAQV